MRSRDLVCKKNNPVNSVGLRDQGSWSEWVVSQRPDLRHLLSLAGYEYDSAADAIVLVFPYVTKDSLTQQACEDIFSEVRRHHYADTDQIKPDCRQYSLDSDDKQKARPAVIVLVAPPIACFH